ncbi:MAG TPA: ATP-binding protein [Candidatus Omnitrophota bacterium]|nr:ATP-binding protein [Candidatus Omnitrophota bacterium]
MTFTHFVYVLLGVNKSNKIELRVSYAVNFLFSICAMFFFYSGWKEKYNFGLWPVPSTVFHVYMLWWFYQVARAFVLILKNGLLVSLGSQKKQYQWIFWSTLIAYVGGATNWLVWYDIAFPPYLNSGIAIYVLVLTYAIFRHRLLGFDLIIKRTLVFAGLLAFVFGIYTFATLFFKNVINDFFTVSEFWVNALAIALIVAGYDPLRKILIDLTDRYFFQKGYNYHQVLKDASRGMAKIESLRHLLGLVLHFITMKMRVENAAVLSFDTQDRLFRLSASRGYKGNVARISLNIDHPLVERMREERDAIQLHDIFEKMDAEQDEVKKQDLKIISDEMIMLGTKCAIPSFLGKELRNVLLIGDKKSGEPHTSEDISLLMTLAQESSIAIENARLYDEAIKKQKQLGQINDQLENSKKMLVQALAQAEGANKQLQDTQAQLIHEQKMATLGRLAASVGHEVNNPLTILSMNVSRAILKFRKNPDLRVNEILDVFDKMEKNIERIKAVVNTLTGLLKKSEKGKFEPLSLKLILEETLPLVQFQTYMDNLTGTEVELNVPGSVPLIRGDLERLQEIFLNLFINAYHAMAGKRFRKIRVDAELDPNEEGIVAIHFTDNGTGMSEETMKKIFNYGYTTKPPGKGSGMGLYMCKYIVELHGGTIRVKSTMGEGTTFTVTLPVYKEEPTAASASQQSPPQGNAAAS